MSRSVDEIVRDMRATIKSWSGTPSKRTPEPSDRDLIGRLDKLLREFPEPTNPDPVKECTKRFQVVASTQTDEEAMRDALLRYRELGCPELEDE